MKFECLRFQLRSHVRANRQNSLTGLKPISRLLSMSDGIIDSIPAAPLTDDSLHGNPGQPEQGTFPTWVNSAAFDLR